MSAKLKDNGGRRSGIDRRQFSYLVHIPERRSGQQRQSEIDRRSGKGSSPENKIERRNIIDFERAKLMRR